MRSSIALLFLVMILCFSCTKRDKEYDSVLQYIPSNSAVVIKINDFNTLRSEIEENKIVKRLLTAETTKRIKKRLLPLKFLKHQSQGLLILTEADKAPFDFLYIPMDTVLSLDVDQISDRLVQSLSEETLTYKQYLLDSISFYTTLLSGRTIMGSSPESFKSIVNNPFDQVTVSGLSKMLKLSDGHKVAQIWLNPQKLDALTSRVNGGENVGSGHKSNDWMSLDLALTNTSLLLNGVAMVADTVHTPITMFTNTRPLPNESATFLPASTNVYQSYTFSDYNRFAKNQAKFKEVSIHKDSLLKTVEEICLAEVKGKKIILVKTYGSENLAEFINAHTKESTEFQGNEITLLDESSFLENYFGPLLPATSTPYISILENTFVFGEDLETLETLINDYHKGNVFTTSNLFKNAQEFLSDESSIVALANGNARSELQPTTFSKGFHEILDHSDLSGYYSGYQIIAENDFFHTLFYIKNLDDSPEKDTASKLFEVTLDADLQTLPQFVENHRTRKMEIVVQDQDNVLYLISTNGKVLWKKPLEGPIQGKIHQVDLYNNGKLQLAFTTSNQFLILDRNGIVVKPFDINFNDGNLNPLAVFDYDNKKDYRFAVTQGKKVFMYDKQGKIVSGFQYKEAEKPILKAPWHFRMNHKDFIVFQLNDNSLKILNRVGRERIKFPDNVQVSENGPKNYKNSIAFTSPDGKLYQISSNGKISKKEMNLLNDHGWEATSKTLAIINDNILRIGDNKVALELGVYTPPQIFYLNDKIYISTTDVQSQKVYLFDSQGKEIPGFPVYGTSSIDMADMDKDKKPELLVKDQDNSLAVYKIQ